MRDWLKDLLGVGPSDPTVYKDTALQNAQYANQTSTTGSLIQNQTYTLDPNALRNAYSQWVNQGTWTLGSVNKPGQYGTKDLGSTPVTVQIGPVIIDLRTGQVTLPEGQSLDEVSLAFWKLIEERCIADAVSRQLLAA